MPHKLSRQSHNDSKDEESEEDSEMIYSNRQHDNQDIISHKSYKSIKSHGANLKGKSSKSIMVHGDDDND